MQHPLLDLLSNWQGRRATESMLEAKGFFLHRLWQKYLVDLCGPENEAALNMYWDEYTTEVVHSAGRINPSNRVFPPQETYRSAYLDELAAAATFAEGRYRNRPFPRCLYEYIQRIFTDRKFHENETKKFESLKKSEIEKFSIVTDGIIERKKDIIPYVNEFSARLGFSQQGNARFVKTLDPVLQLEILVDTGGFQELGAGLPLHFLISYTQDRSFVFRLTKFDIVIPGFSKYDYFETGKGCVLGIRASVEAFSVFVNSFYP